MAMTDEELLLQMNILTSKTESNPNMAYKTNATLNKGLNPEYFTGNYTKIVNAINKLAADAAMANMTANDVANKVNSIMLDTNTIDGAALWEQVQVLMDKPTIIEGIQNILEGNRQEQILGLTADDIGKVLSVQQNEDGNLVVKAIDAAIGGNPVPSEINAQDVAYSNENYPELNNVSNAIDFLLQNRASGDSGILSPVFWEDIQNKPEIPTSLSLEEDKLCLQSEDGTLSSVEIVTDSDVNSIIEELN